MCVCMCMCVRVYVYVCARARVLSVLPSPSIDIKELSRFSHSGAELASHTRTNVFDVELALAEMGDFDVDNPCPMFFYLC